MDGMEGKHFRGELRVLWGVTKMFIGGWLRFLIKVLAVLAVWVLGVALAVIFATGLNVVVPLVAPALALVSSIFFLVMTIACSNGVIHHFWKEAPYRDNS